MAYKAEKTEHTGAKHGRGAYWGTKSEAKKESGKIRRRNSYKDLRQQLVAGAIANRDLDREMAKEWFPLDQEAWDQLPE